MEIFFSSPKLDHNRWIRKKMGESEYEGKVPTLFSSFDIMNFEGIKTYLIFGL